VRTLSIWALVIIEDPLQYSARFAGDDKARPRKWKNAAVEEVETVLLEVERTTSTGQDY
jgi:hypothetical protein